MGNQTKPFNLNEAQYKAVQASDGPVLVVAGAGTGKTSVIVSRIQRLAREGTPPERILALTFTEKAAAEMADRVNQALGGYQTEMPLMTFNGFGEQLLRRYGTEIGLGRNFRLIGENSRIVFLRERIDELRLDYFAPLSRPDSLLGDIADYFSRLKQYVITPEFYFNFAKQLPTGDEAEKLEKLKHMELSSAYDIYIKACRQANVIDYDDQIFLTIEMFKRRPNVLRKIRDSYDYVMVDEFQDTNAMQSALTDMLVDSRQNLFVVGDDDQSIYGWRGATLDNILSFKKRYPKAKDITLSRNYRSTRQILDKAYSLIQHNNPHRLEIQLGIDKKLVTDKSGTEPQVCRFSNLDQELAWIAEDVKRRLETGAKPGEIAVMTRRNQTSRLLHDALDAAGIEHIVAGERYDPYQEPAVGTLLEALKTIADPLDNTSLYHTLTGPLFSVPAGVLSPLNAEVRRHHDSLEAAILRSKDEQLTAARKALDIINSWRNRSSGMTVGQLTYEIFDLTGYKDKLYKAVTDDMSAVRAIQSVSELFKIIREFEIVAVVPSVIQFVEALPALQAAGESIEDPTLDLSDNAVNVLTIHKAKGLEWPIVYIADCTEGSFPLKRNFRGIELPDELIAIHKSPADEHLMEERRLMYVAMTRARDHLIMTYSDSHATGSSRQPSRFLKEAFGDEDFPLKETDENVSVQTIRFNDGGKHPDADIPVAMLKSDHVHLNVSQLSTYLDCPLEFYYRYVLQVPQEPSPVMRYGTLIHNLIERINRGLMEGSPPDITELLEQLNVSWPKAGYMSVNHRERAYDQAKKTIRAVYDRLIMENRIPVAVEEPFAFSLNDANISVSGRFDAVLPLGNSVEIVDYKTSSNVDTAAKAKSRAASSPQLTFYALAWQLTHDEIPALVSLEFVETGQKGSVKKTARGLDTALRKIRMTAEGVRARNFQPGKSHLFCTHPQV